ncbi:MAG: dihydrolipoamide acetyltransferase family protein [Flavobacteriales bacterium Tduv]
MAEVITMPRLSDTMETGKIIKWHKKVGDKVSEGDILAEIETDKATQDFEIDVKGTLLYIGVEEEQRSKVDDILAIIGEAGEHIGGLIGKKNDSNASPEKFISGAAIPTVSEKNTTNIRKDTQKEPRKTDEKQRILASPLAKKIAVEKGIVLGEISGSGENGRIIKRDIEQHQSVQTKTAENIATILSVTPPLEQREVFHSSIRKIIAKRLAESKFTAPHYYLTMEIDMEQAIQSRRAINEKLSDVKVSFNDLVIKATSLVLREHPQINTSWAEEKIIYHPNVHIGIAVAVEDGLLVPVIPQTDQKSLRQISEEVKDKVLRARTRKIQAQEMEGSTFTISNLGMFGIESFTSIINQPNSCILSVGTIIEKPVVKGGQVVAGHTMKVTLACDHRTVDGATGSSFLQTFKNLLENPLLMLA